MNDTSKSGFKFEIEEKDEINELKQNLNKNSNDYFYEADDLHVGNIQEELKYMFTT